MLDYYSEQEVAAWGARWPHLVPPARLQWLAERATAAQEAVRVHGGGPAGAPAAPPVVVPQKRPAGGAAEGDGHHLHFHANGADGGQPGDGGGSCAHKVQRTGTGANGHTDGGAGAACRNRAANGAASGEAVRNGNGGGNSRDDSSSGSGSGSDDEGEGGPGLPSPLECWQRERVLGLWLRLLWASEPQLRPTLEVRTTWPASSSLAVCWLRAGRLVGSCRDKHVRCTPHVRAISGAAA